MVAHVGCSCSRFTRNDYYDIFGQVKEGFSGIGKYTPYASYPQGTNEPNIDIASDAPALQTSEEIRNRKKQPIPLPEGEHLLFGTTPFKPECCPNTYSDSTGCACMTTDQFNYLVGRGGNNSPNGDI